MDSAWAPWSSRFDRFCCITVLIFWLSCSEAANPACNPNNYTEGSKVATNVVNVLNNLVNASSQPAAFNISVAGEGNNTVYGLFQCRGDQTAAQCFSCSRDARKNIQETCGRKLGAAIWNNTCFMRFETYNFTGTNDQNSLLALYNTDTVSDPDSFDAAKKNLLTKLSIEAGSSPATRYAANSTSGGTLSIYGLVQCWQDISMDDCKNCLDSNLKYILNFSSTHKGALSVTRSCLAEYEIQSFFESPAINFSSPTVPAPAVPAASGGSKDSNHVAVILGATGGTVLLLILIGFVIWLRKKNPRKDVVEDDSLADDDEDRIIFTTAMLKLATKDFHDDLKLGEGGFGAVYKGTLPNGTEIAVKKLSFRSSQGNVEFMNEIKLLVKIQHRNLVNLLGCCVDGAQRFLVYEYLPNRSLDKIIFDSTKKMCLDWPQRFQIIVGAAKGLLYLHEDSKLKIIHRDIKAANILLGDTFNPKIADFGLAKLFPDDETKIHTRVAGTYGYMAPEYAMQGQLSIKADVYSFGILVLEIVSGRKNGDFDLSNGGQSVLVETWRLFQQGNVMDIVDGTICSSCVPEQVIRCLHVGLLCTQADSSLRPPMSTVILMLSSASLTLPNPKLLAFMSFNNDDDATNTSCYASTQQNESLSMLYS